MSAPSFTLSWEVGMERRGQEGMKPRRSLLLNHRRRESHRLQVQTNSMFVLLLIHASSKLNSSPEQRGPALQRGAAPPAWGLGEKQADVPPAPTHTLMHTHGAQRGFFGKHSLSPSCCLCTVTPHTAPGPILPPLLPLKLLQPVALLQYAAASLRALQIVRIKSHQYGNQGSIYHWQKTARIFLNQRFSYSRTFVTGADL